MNCILCSTQTTRKLKGNPLCKSCLENARDTRDKLNETRKNPANVFNPEGEKPITLLELVMDTFMKNAQAQMNEGEENNENA